MASVSTCVPFDYFLFIQQILCIKPTVWDTMSVEEMPGTKGPSSLRSVRWSQPGWSWGGFMWKVVLELVLGWLKCWQARAGWTAWDFQSLNENEWWNCLHDFWTYSIFRHSVNDYKCMISSTLQITELTWSRDCNLQLIDEEPLAQRSEVAGW